MQIVELGLEDLHETPGPSEPVSLERGEDVQDTLGAGRLALALLPMGGLDGTARAPLPTTSCVLRSQPDRQCHR